MKLFSKAVMLIALSIGWVTIVEADERSLPQPRVEPASIQQITTDQHNAFTALARWKGSYWLAYRKASSHTAADGDIILQKSSDSRDWQEVKRFNYTEDDRDPVFLATDDRLFMYVATKSGSTNGKSGKKLVTVVTYTDDGENWSDPKPVYERQFFLWRPIEHQGKYYATAHRLAGNLKREVHLVASTDGITWNKVSLIRKGNRESETSIYFPSDDKVVAFLREKGVPTAAIMEAEAPFTEWTERRVNVPFAGHCVNTFDGTTYLISRANRPRGTMVYTYENGQLTPYCNLRSNHVDCAYAIALQDGDEMLISYYSTIDGKANVYVARVPLRKQGDTAAAR